MSYFVDMIGLSGSILITGRILAQLISYSYNHRKKIIFCSHSTTYWQAIGLAGLLTLGNDEKSFTRIAAFMGWKSTRKHKRRGNTRVLFKVLVIYLIYYGQLVNLFQHRFHQLNLYLPVYFFTFEFRSDLEGAQTVRKDMQLCY